MSVRWIARQFAGRERAEEVKGGVRWGARRDRERREDPTRAKVLGLRRFWEGVGKSVVSVGIVA